MNRSPLLIIFLTVFIDLIGFGIVMPVLPIYAERFGAGPVVVGLLLASFSFFQFLAAPILGRLSDRYGRRPVLFLSLLGTAAGFLLLGLAGSLWVLFMGRIIDGISGGNISTAQAYIADVTTPENRARALGMVGAAFGLGFIIGPVIGGVLSAYGYAVPFLFAAGLALANALLLYFRLPETVKAGGRARRGETGWRLLGATAADPGLRLVLVIYFMSSAAFAALTATLTLYTKHATEFRYDATYNGYLFAFIGLVAAVVQGGLLGRLVKRCGESVLVAGGLLTLAASLVLLPFASTAGALLVAAGLVAVGNGLATPSLTALASRRTSAAHQGSILGTTQSLNSLARVVGPVVGNILLEAALRQAAGNTSQTATAPGRALAAPFLVSAALAAISFALALYYNAYWAQPAQAQPELRPPA